MLNPEPNKVDLSGLNVMLIDDDAGTRIVLHDLLNELGITKISPMSNAAKALQFLKDYPDWRGLILCDWNMPGMSGAAFHRSVKQTHVNLPFVMITGRNDEDSVQFAKDSGIYAYLLKPVSLGELEKKITKVAVNHISALPLPIREPSYSL